MSNSNNARDCAIKCGQDRFRAFMRERLAEPGIKDGLDEIPDWVEVKTPADGAFALRYLINIESRKELNEAGPALSRWNALLDAYEGWKRGIY